MDENNIIICRCEDITLKKLRDVLQNDTADLEEVKRLLRCGMGLCQGRTCMPMVVREIARAQGVELSQVEPPTVRQPIQPVKFSSILESVHEK